MRSRRKSRIAFATLAALGIAFWVSLTPGDPEVFPAAAGAPSVEIHVADHGWHAGLIVEVEDLLAAGFARQDRAPEEAAILIALARTMAAGDWVEIGWGDEGFYRAEAVSALEVDPAVIARALFLPTPTVMHVFAGLGPPAEAFPGAQIQSLRLSATGFDRLAGVVARAFAPGPGGLPEDQGPGVYGYARFYAARGAYTALRTCNNWVAEALRAAGVPASWSTSAFSAGLMMELRLRSRPLE